MPQAAAAAALDDYTPRETGDEGARVRAHRNESAFGAPRAVVDAIRSLGADDLRRYPAGRYEALARLVAERLGVDEAGVAFANGSDDLILALAAAYLQPGTNVAVVKPTFSMYARAARLQGAGVREAAYPQRWRMDARALLGVCDERTRLVFLAHPANPTGEYLDPAVVEGLLASLPQAIVVVDEAYLAEPAKSYFGAVRGYDNLAVIATLSKVAGLAGLRCGFGAASPAGRAGDAARHAAAPALGAGRSRDGSVLRRASTATRRTAQRIARSSPPASTASPPNWLRSLRVTRTQTNFLVLEFGERAARVERALADAGIAVRTLGAEFDGGLRVNALSSDETAEFIDGRESRTGGRACVTDASGASRARRRSTSRSHSTSRARIHGSTTGLRFFDHMLEAFCLYSGIAVTGEARSLDGIEHHIVEDVAMVLGGAIADALGDRARDRAVRLPRTSPWTTRWRAP